MSTAAELLYGGTTPAEPTAQSAEPSAPTSNAETGEALYGNAKTVGEAASTYGSALRQIEGAAIERLNMSPEDASASVADWAGRFQSYGIDGAQADQLVAIGLGAIAGNVDQSGWANQARAALTRDFGDGAHTALADAKALVAKDPALAAWLDQTGLGDHPKVVSVIANRARQLRSRGRL